MRTIPGVIFSCENDEGLVTIDSFNSESLEELRKGGSSKIAFGFAKNRERTEKTVVLSRENLIEMRDFLSAVIAGIPEQTT